MRTGLTATACSCALLALAWATASSAAPPTRIVLDGTPGDSFFDCGFPTTIATTGTLIISSGGVITAANFHEIFANPATGATLDLRSAGTEFVSETETEATLEARGLYAQIVVPGVGVIHLDVGNVLITFDFETGEADVEGSGKWSDFPVDQVCALLSG